MDFLVGANASNDSTVLPVLVSGDASPRGWQDSPITTARSYSSFFFSSFSILARPFRAVGLDAIQTYLTPIARENGSLGGDEGNSAGRQISGHIIDAHHAIPRRGGQMI